MKNNLDLIRGFLGNNIFSATFQKVNGDIRTGTFRLNVKKGVSGVGLKYDSAERNNLIVYDMQKKAFRTIKLDRLIEIKCNGKTINLGE